MNPLKKILMLGALSTGLSAEAYTFVDQVQIIDWSAPLNKRVFYDCAFEFIDLNFPVNRESNDSNYLYTVCDDVELVEIESWEVPMYLTHGASFEEMGFSGAGPYLELLGCYMTLMTSGRQEYPHSYVVIECEDNAAVENGAKEKRT